MSIQEMINYAKERDISLSITAVGDSTFEILELRIKKGPFTLCRKISISEFDMTNIDFITGYFLHMVEEIQIEESKVTNE